MRILAIDTAANLCAACIWDAGLGRESGRAVLDLGKGHAEHLMEVIEAALEKAGCSFGELGLIAVSIGPGSFTGVRVGVAAARGLALALAIPAIGISTLDALAHEQPDVPVLAVIAAGRGQVYVASYGAGGTLLFGPAVLSVDEVIALIAKASTQAVLAGSGARALADAAGRGDLTLRGEDATADIAAYARLAAARLADRPDAAFERPHPLYLRAADAKPQTAFALPRKAPA